MNGGRERLKTAAICVFLAVWFLSRTWRGIFVYFSDDDLMNLYKAWTTAWYKLAIAAVVPFTSVYRPTGALFYVALYHFFGLNPLPFRICTFALMMLNVWVLYRVARLLTGSREVGVLAAVIGCYHSRLIDLLVNGGAIYDILCFTFFWSAFAVYVDSKQKYGEVTGWRLAGFCALFTLALNSKEMAVTMPAILFAYEWIYHRPELRFAPVSKWIVRAHALWISVLITALAILAKMGSQGPFIGNPGYKVTWSMQQLFSTLRPLTDELLALAPGTLKTAGVLALYGLVWAVALFSRKKPLLFCAAVIVIAPLPVNLIVYRGFFVMYLPLVGWAIYTASILIYFRDWLWRAAWDRSEARAISASERAIWALLVVFVVFEIQNQDTYTFSGHVPPSQGQIRTLKENLFRIRPVAPSNGGVLFLRDPFEADSWNWLYVVRLLYRDDSIPVSRMNGVTHGSPLVEAQKYNLILDYCGAGYVEVPPRATLGLPDDQRRCEVGDQRRYAQPDGVGRDSDQQQQAVRPELQNR